MMLQWRATGSAVGLVLLVTAGPALAQAASDATPYPIRVTYDSISDSTTRSVEVQRGRYFLHFHKPRVTVALTYHGRTAPAEPVGCVVDGRLDIAHHGVPRIAGLDVRATVLTHPLSEFGLSDK